MTIFIHINVLLRILILSVLIKLTELKTPLMLMVLLLLISSKVIMYIYSIIDMNTWVEVFLIEYTNIMNQFNGDIIYNDIISFKSLDININHMDYMNSSNNSNNNQHNFNNQNGQNSNNGGGGQGPNNNNNFNSVAGTLTSNGTQHDSDNSSISSQEPEIGSIPEGQWRQTLSRLENTGRWGPEEERMIDRGFSGISSEDKHDLPRHAMMARVYVMSGGQDENWIIGHCNQKQLEYLRSCWMNDASNGSVAERWSNIQYMKRFLYNDNMISYLENAPRR